eukprot:TRINITY_DN56601_c0_g1_i5.p1 TRINITY_DN56601_c0_g1~~TRINITY_DN56601_c0_g1_i5.p1  ORF type:complete len:169 (-),score=25.90 TRINITY_DN56601_c0_g1_i5:222-728(-)
MEWQQSTSSQIDGQIVCGHVKQEGKEEEEGEKENVKPSNQGVESTTVGIPVDASNQCNFKNIWQQQEQEKRGQTRSSKIKHFFNALVNSGIEGLSGSRRQLLDSNPAQKLGEVVDIENRGTNVQELMQPDLDASPHWRCVRLGCRIGWYAGLAAAGVLSVFVLSCLLF